MERVNHQDILKKDTLEVSSYLIYNDEYRKLSNDAKIMYQYLIKRFTVSKVNYAEAITEDNLEEFTFIDKNNDVFCICSNDELRFVLGVSENKVIDCKKELVKVKLLDEAKQTTYLPNRIYVGKVKMDLNDKKAFDATLKSFKEVEKLKRKEKNAKRLNDTVRKSAKVAPNNQVVTSEPQKLQFTETKENKCSEPQKNKFSEPQKNKFSEPQNLRTSTKEFNSTEEFISTEENLVSMYVPVNQSPIEYFKMLIKDDPSKYVQIELGNLENTYGKDFVNEAIKRLADKNTTKYIATLRGILKNWTSKDAKTLEDVKKIEDEHKKQYKQKKQAKGNRPPIRDEKVPDWLNKEDDDEEPSEWSEENMKSAIKFGLKFGKDMSKMAKDMKISEEQLQKYVDDITKEKEQGQE